MCFSVSCVLSTVGWQPRKHAPPLKTKFGKSGVSETLLTSNTFKKFKEISHFLSKRQII